MHDTVAHFSELRARGTYVTYGFITGTYVSCKIRPLGPCFAVLPAGDLLPDQITPPSPRRPRSGRTVDLEFSARVQIAGKSAAPQHSDAPHKALGPLRLVTRLHTASRHGFRRHLARFRTKNFAAAKNFENFRSKSRRNPPRHSMPTLRTARGDFCGSWQGSASPIGRDFGAISRDLGRKTFCGREKF